MGSSTPACSRTAESARIFVLAAILSLGACSGPAEEGRIELTRVDSSWSNGKLSVTSEQKFILSEEARNALMHGVPLTFELELVLRNSSSQTHSGELTSSYEISYLPLSNYFQLTFTETEEVKTFPRLRHVLAELSRLKVSVETGIVPAGDYELLARVSLDQHKMPPPMRLPVLLLSKWQHDSRWTSWPLQIDPGA